MSDKKIGIDEFIKIWESARTRREVAEKCGTTGSAVGMRATKLKKQGFILKNFRRGRPLKVIAATA